MNRTEDKWNPPEEVEIYYGKGGNLCEQSECLAKILQAGKSEYYFIWIFRGNVYDPYGIDTPSRSNRMLFKMVRVGRDSFENYIKYLKSKNRAFYNICNRTYRGR